MATQEQYENEAAYRCDECGLHYTEQARAGECEQWCRSTSSCNTEIIQDALENQ